MCLLWTRPEADLICSSSDIQKAVHTLLVINIFSSFSHIVICIGFRALGGERDEEGSL